MSGAAIGGKRNNVDFGLKNVGRMSVLVGSRYVF